MAKKLHMKNRSYTRDLIVYTITSIRYLLLKGQYRLFMEDLFAFTQWRRYRVSSKGTLNYQIPWLVFSTISFLDQWLKKDMKVFEYGSGGSTLYFAGKAKHVVSVEHDKEWYQHANKTMQERGVTTISYALIEPQVLQTNAQLKCTDPAHYISCFHEYSGYEFSAYAKAIEQYENESFHLVIVDGRVRHSCIAHAIPKIKKNGALLLDNADRSYYLQPFPELFDETQWKQTTFIGHFPFGPASVVNTSKLFIKLY